jgi:hypothetical protein
MIGLDDVAVVFESKKNIPPQEPGKLCQEKIVILGTDDKEQIAKSGGSSATTESDEIEATKKWLCSNIVKITMRVEKKFMIGVLILLTLIVGIITGSVLANKIAKNRH